MPGLGTGHPAAACVVRSRERVTLCHLSAPPLQVLGVDADVAGVDFRQTGVRRCAAGVRRQQRVGRLGCVATMRSGSSCYIHAGPARSRVEPAAHLYGFGLGHALTARLALHAVTRRFSLNSVSPLGPTSHLSTHPPTLARTHLLTLPRAACPSCLPDWSRHRASWSACRCTTLATCWRGRACCRAQSPW